MMMQNYRFGFNGKEKDDEVYGSTGNSYDFGARLYDPRVGQWLSLDPLAAKYAGWSPYNFVLGNPIRFIDPDGRAPDDYVFSEKGDFLRIDRNDLPDKLVIENQQTMLKTNYEFSDPDADTKQIEAGTINKVVFVTESRMQGMLQRAGAFSAENRDHEWSYMNKESKGKGKLDFSYTSIPAEFAAEGASSNPLVTPSPMLFIPEGGSSAENHMNFGNYLWGAAGHSLGFSSFLLKAAAQYNSKFNSETNGHPSQWDSPDDQRSIGRGVQHSEDEGYRGITK